MQIRMYIIIYKYIEITHSYIHADIHLSDKFPYTDLFFYTLIFICFIKYLTHPIK